MYHWLTLGLWTSLVVQWLRLHTSTAGGTGSIPSQGSSTYHMVWPKSKIKKKRLGFCLIKKNNSGLPGGAVVESLPADAGDTGSSPGLGRSHMPRSGWAREPQLLSLCIWSLCSATREAAIVRGPRTAMRSSPRLPQLEKALAQKRRPNTAKKKKKLKNQVLIKKKKIV